MIIYVSINWRNQNGKEKNNFRLIQNEREW